MDIYGPLIYRFGRRKGLQDSDATDVMQNVFTEVSRYIGSFEYDPAIGRFRSWLFVITNHTIGRLLKSRDRQPVGSGDSGVVELLKQLPDDSLQDEVWNTEYQNQLFQWASEQIRSEFKESTWKAFWSTAVEGKNTEQTAQSLGLSVGAVYIARSRVTRRLKEKVRTVDESFE